MIASVTSLLDHSAGDAAALMQVAGVTKRYGDQRALADVGRDVPRTEIEKLDPVGLVQQDKFFGIAPLGVAGLAKHLRRCLGERPLVGDRDLDQGTAGVHGPHSS